MAPVPGTRGRRNAGFPVLTATEVREIRARHSEGVSCYSMAREYRMDPQTIANVVKRRSHKGVE